MKISHIVRAFPKQLFAEVCAIALCLCAAASPGDAQANTPQQNDTVTCDETYADHGVYDATLVFFIDERTQQLFLPIDADRNTPDFRRSAYQFFKTEYGLNADPGTPGEQHLTDKNGGTASVRGFKLDVGSTHQVYALDAQHIPHWRHKMPLTNVAIFDDGYTVFVGPEGFTVHGKLGGEPGLLLPPGTLMISAQYRLFDEHMQLLDTIDYQSETPSLGIPALGENAFFVAINSVAQSKIFGTGTLRALGKITPLAVDDKGNTTLQDVDIRYVLRFPSRRGDATVKQPRCQEVQPLKK